MTKYLDMQRPIDMEEYADYYNKKNEKMDAKFKGQLNDFVGSTMKRMNKIYQDEPDVFLNADKFNLKPTDLLSSGQIKKVRSHSTVYNPLFNMVYCGYIYIANIRYRLFDLQKNWTALCAGAVGSGKSMAMLFFSALVDPSFNVDRIVFTPKDYLHMIKVIKKGQFILWDEAGAGIGSRDFATKLNRNIGKIFQTQRYKQFGVAMTAPALNLIDKQPRELLNALINMKKILRSYKTSVASIYENKVDLLRNKVRPVLPRIKIGDTIYKIRDFSFRLPDKKLVREYDKIKDEFFQKNVLGKALKDEITQEDKIFGEHRKKELANQKVEETLDKVMKEPFMFGKMKNGIWRLQTKRIQTILGIDRDTAETARYKAEYNLAHQPK